MVINDNAYVAARNLIVEHISHLDGLAVDRARRLGLAAPPFYLDTPESVVATLQLAVLLELREALTSLPVAPCPLAPER